jgi:predicted RNA-binding protein with RPS1 domain
MYQTNGQLDVHELQKQIQSIPAYGQKKKTAKSLYQVGDMVECTITVVDQMLGAFVNTADGASGLIHMENIIENENVNPADYLEKNQKVQGKIAGFDKKGNAKITVFHLNLDNQEEVKEEVQETSRKAHVMTFPTIAPETKKVKSLEEENEALLKRIEELENEKNQKEQQEKETLKKVIQAIVPSISPNAEELMNDLLDKHGISHFSMGLSRATMVFDPSLEFMKMIQQNIERGYL